MLPKNTFAKITAETAAVVTNLDKNTLMNASESASKQNTTYFDVAMTYVMTVSAVQQALLHYQLSP